MNSWLDQITILPESVSLLIIFIFGAIIGSFLNVYIYRFHTGKSLNGRSHCMSCGTSLKWYELFPLFSYLCLRGHCRTCKCLITPRYFLVEVTTAILFVLAGLVSGGPVEFLWLLLMLSVLLVVTVYDYNHFIIPDEMTIALTLLTTGWIGYQWWLGLFTNAVLGWTIFAAVAGAGFLFFLWAVSRGQWLGFGDVKLAIPLGLWVGPTLVFSFVVVSFWVGAAISLLILGWQKHKRGKQSLHLSEETLTMKSAVPFAPFMIIGAVLVYFLNFDVLTLFSFK